MFPAHPRRHTIALSAALALAACAPGESLDGSADTGARDAGVDTGPPPRAYPAPGDWPANRGPGMPRRTFSDEELLVNCALLDGGEEDRDHHNMAVMFDGYLLLPWAHEATPGGLSFFDISDPCAPVHVSTTNSREMRESHTIGFARIDDRWWAVTAHMRKAWLGGAQFWDLSDIESAEVVSHVHIEDYFYPDAYKYTVLSTFWQAPYVYLGASQNGVVIVDASDPRDPREVGRYLFEPVMQVGQVQAVGDLLVVTAAEGSRTVLLDISDPTAPQPIPGGDFDIADGDGHTQEAYFSNLSGHHIYFARKSGGGGVIVYDISDPTSPAYAGDYHSDGNGGYVFVHGHHAFVGESRFAAIYDVSDLGAIEEVARVELEGDLDTLTPLGNLAVLSVDDKAVDGEASAIAPWRAEPDSRAPRIEWVWPPDGSEDRARTTRIGVTFDEMIDVKSAWEGSVRLYVADSEPARTRVDLILSVQETILNITPSEPLEPGTTYELRLPADGITDFSGNALAEDFTMRLTTAGP